MHQVSVRTKCFHIVLAALILLALAACGGRGLPGFGGTGAAGNLQAAAVPSVSEPKDVSEIIAALDALKLPKGVDEATFSMIRTAIADALQQRADTRVASAAPGAGLGQVDTAFPLDAGSYTISFSWDEHNPGDYDLSGEVNVKDATVLAMYYGKQAGEDGWALARVADGNTDGQIDTQDAVVIAEHYLSRISGYTVYRSLQGGSNPELLARVGRDEAVVLDGVKVQYHYEDTAIEGPGVTYIYEVRPYAGPQGEDEGIASNSFELSAGSSYGILPAADVQSISVDGATQRLALARELLVTFDSAPSYEQLLGIVYNTIGGELLGQLPGSLTYRVRLPQDARRSVANVVEQRKSASSADGYTVEPNYLVPGPAPIEFIGGGAGSDKGFSQAYSDPLRSQLWGLDAAYADAAWDTAEGAGVVVAVIDSGVETTHEDLVGQTVQGVRYGGSDAWDDDTCGHGTHVAGTIAAAAGNGKGVVGLANKVKIMPVRCGAAYSGSWSFPVSDLVSGINYAVQNGAKVINMSLGGQGTLGTAFETALATAESNGVVVLAAAGNDNTSAQGYYPATYSTVVSVGAIGPALSRAPFSNYGYPQYVDICAPGGDGTWNGAILSTIPTSTSSYDRMQGTSMACPHASAVAALILSASPSMTAEQVRQTLHDTGRTITASAQVGPLINAQAALAVLGAPGTYAVSGSVKRADNTPLAGASIVLSGMASRTVTTDSNGAFTVTGLADGSYTVTPSKPGYTFEPASLTVAVSGQPVTGANFTAAQGAGVETENNDAYSQANSLPDLPFAAGTMSGSLGKGTGYAGVDGDTVDFYKFTISIPSRVTFTLGFNSSTANLDIRILNTNGSTVLATASTSGAPEVVAASLPIAGTYYVKCSCATGYSDYTLAASVAPTYSVGGKITKLSDGKALSGVTVALAGSGISLSAKTTATGDYTISGVPDGAYTLTPTLTGRSFTPSSISATVSGTALTGQNFIAEGPFTVTGAVYLKTGSALANAVLTLTGNSLTLTALSAADGKFTISNVPNGSYTLRCAATGKSFEPAVIDVVVAGASEAGCYFLGEGPYSVSGTITNSAGASLASVICTLTGNGYTLKGTTNTLGKFTISGAPNGTYTVTPSSRGRTFSPASQAVTIQSGNVTGVNFTGAGPFKVSGHISNAADNLPVASVKVTLTGAGQTLSATTNANGDYSIPYVANGDYVLTAARTGRVFTPSSASIAVAGADVTARNFSSYPVYSVGGKVTLNGVALSGATLVLAGANGTFSAQTSSTGLFSLTGVPAGSYTLTPSLAGRVFTPASKSISITTANISSQNFTAK